MRLTVLSLSLLFGFTTRSATNRSAAGAPVAAAGAAAAPGVPVRGRTEAVPARPCGSPGVPPFLVFADCRIFCPSIFYLFPLLRSAACLVFLLSPIFMARLKADIHLL